MLNVFISLYSSAIIQESNAKGKVIGLHMNLAKTKRMTNKEAGAIFIDGKEIDYVGEHVYVGQIISTKIKMTRK